jgi:hypothetical protein
LGVIAKLNIVINADSAVIIILLIDISEPPHFSTQVSANFKFGYHWITAIYGLHGFPSACAIVPFD